MKKDFTRREIHLIFSSLVDYYKNCCLRFSPGNSEVENRLVFDESEEINLLIAYFLQQVKESW